VGNRANVLLTSGRTVRISVDVNTSSPLVRDCLEALQCVLPLDLTYNILSRLLQGSSMTTLAFFSLEVVLSVSLMTGLSLAEQSTAGQPHHEPEWHSFTQTIIGLFNAAYPVATKAIAKPPPSKSKGTCILHRRRGGIPS
jgi:hypothetical protein